MQEVFVENAQEATVAVGWLRPFLRVTGAKPAELSYLEQEGIALRDLAEPDTRIGHKVAMTLLAQKVRASANPALGLAAGEAVDASDMNALGYAVRSSETVRDAIQTASRYMALMHSALEARLCERGERATWELAHSPETSWEPAANDFMLVTASTFARRATGVHVKPFEVHFEHAHASDVREYERVFDRAEIKLGMRCNAIVFERSFLDVPMLDASPLLKAAFELHAGSLLDRLRRGRGVSGRVRELVAAQLGSGDVNMGRIARRLGMSAATLRRRLEEEHTNHSCIVDEVRRELATKYLTDRSLAISEVAFLLGFSHVTAFYKAFRRWTQGETPAEFRSRAAE